MRHLFLLCALAAVVATACGDGDDSANASANTTTTVPAARVPWEQLKNPIFATDAMAKDQAVVFADGRWHLLFSSRSNDPRYTGLGHVVSTDLRDWKPVTPRAPNGGSPDVTRDVDGNYIVTFQTDRSENTELNWLVARTTPRLDALGNAPETKLFPALFPNDRLIDVALARTDKGTFAIFKRGLHEATEQFTHLAYSPSGSLEGPWELLGEPNVGWFENYQFLEIDGKWHVLGTRIPVHVPELWRLDGNPADPKAWLKWTKVRDLTVPGEAWNSGGKVAGIDFERANSAYLFDNRVVDGYFYLFYAGSTELQTNAGRGWSKIGVARSNNLENWSVP
jgi:hypothetical protein